VDIPVFSINDVLLLFSMVQCLLMGTLLLLVNNIAWTKRCFLALFLLAMGADFADTLIYWSESVKSHVFTDSVFPFFILKLSGFIVAPALYFYVKSILFSDFVVTRKTLLHFAPAALFLVLLPVYLYSRDTAFFINARSNYEYLFHDWPFHGYLAAKHMSFIAYGACASWLLLTYHRYLEQGYSSIHDANPFGLRFLVLGFWGIWLAYFSSYLAHLLFESVFFANLLGLWANYLNVLFINSLVVYGLAKSMAFKGVEEYDPSQDSTGKQPANGQGTSEQEQEQENSLAPLLDQVMRQHKFYLDPELTLDQFARALGYPRRLVSHTINHQYHKNFFEFVNDYRMREACDILRDPAGEDAMLEVMEKSGFNSKSTFNRCFKRATGITPREFRERYKDGQ